MALGEPEDPLNLTSPPATSNVKSAPTSSVKSAPSEIVEPLIVISSAVIAPLLIVPTVILGVPDKPIAVMPSALISD